MRFLVGAVLLASLCASAFADPVPIQKAMPSYMEGDLGLAVIPTPQEAEYGQKLFPVGDKVEIQMPPGDYGAPRTVVEQLNQILDGSGHKGKTRVIVGGPSRNRAAAELLRATGLKMPGSQNEDTYVLEIGEGSDGQLSIVLAGSTPAGDFWACQTLRQLTCKVDGVVYVRGAKIRDWPDFPYRGNKRPKRWEYRFKANYAWGYPGDKPELAEVFRRHGAWIQHIAKLDTSKARIDELCADARKRYEKGCREFVLKYDDTGQGMTRETAARFKGNYYEAQVCFLSTMYERIKKWDAQNTVFFMPQQYWANA
ncbi:MAG: hypothetical protein KGZ25_03900, partial [Planctomycetes bacterium]|nr:hypothetical protein [Planctomycetota bacterium]